MARVSFVVGSKGDIRVRAVPEKSLWTHVRGLGTTAGLVCRRM